MLSKATQKRIVKVITITSITSTVATAIPNITYAATTNPSEISDTSQESFLDQIIKFGTSIYACGKEFADAYSTYNDVKYIKFHFLPINGEANSTVQLINPNNGKLLQTRVYDENGKPYMDIDYTSHGDGAFTKKIHKHIWKDGVRQLNEELTKEEHIRYFMIPNGYVDSGGSRFKPLYDVEGEMGIQLTYDDFIEAVKQNRDIRFKVGDTVFNWTYGRDKQGNGKYKLIYMQPFLGIDVLEYKTFNSRHGLLEFRLHGHTFEEIWDHVSILSIN